MKPPIHCGKPAKPYFKKYFEGKICHSIEWGFQCPVCNQIRIPTGEPLDQSFMAGLDALREQAIAFWGDSFNAFPLLIQKRKALRGT